jgi:hypothetical protein
MSVGFTPRKAPPSDFMFIIAARAAAELVALSVCFEPARHFSGRAATGRSLRSPAP